MKSIGKTLSICELTEDLYSRKRLLELLTKSNSQIGQDLFALVSSNFKLGGYYVEIGATDGVGISNTLLLAREFEWNGILCEPSHFWKQDLLTNRPESEIDTRCCWSTSGTFVEFFESDEKELSTIYEFKSLDRYRKERRQGKKYVVETVSLEDLLIQNNAPKVVDFLSIDTEGSEFLILKNFPFDKYIFKSVVVEHNFGNNMNEIQNIFTEAGYSQVCENVSSQDFWFIYQA